MNKLSNIYSRIIGIPYDSLDYGKIDDLYGDCLDFEPISIILVSDSSLRSTIERNLSLSSEFWDSEILTSFPKLDSKVKLYFNDKSIITKNSILVKLPYIWDYSYDYGLSKENEQELKILIDKLENERII